VYPKKEEVKNKKHLFFLQVLIIKSQLKKALKRLNVLFLFSSRLYCRPRNWHRVCLTARGLYRR